jgi:ATP-dependent Clp protease adaptor protein ClpS
LGAEGHNLLEFLDMKPFLSIDIDPFEPNLVIRMGGEDSEYEGDVLTDVREKVEKPKFFKVLLHNDDYTTMEFVLHVLQKFFSKSPEDAQRIMLKVHNEGIGVCGVYTFEIAETKVDQVKRAAVQSGQPLQCSLEEE